MNETRGPFPNPLTNPAAKTALIAGLSDFGYAGLRVNGDGTGGSEAVVGGAGAVLNGASGTETGQGLSGKRRLISRRWRDGNVACANGGWRLAA